jgi:small-conductance mechanosensitive channel
MLKNIKAREKLNSIHKKPLIITTAGALIMIVLVVITLEISRRNPNTFVSDQQKYIITVESTLLIAFVVELLARLVTLRPHTPRMTEFGSRLRFIVRIVGYGVGLLAIVAILASNAALGISVGAIIGALIVFSAQNIVGGVLAAAVIFGTRMVRVGEEITIGPNTGVVSDISLTHTVISVEEDVVFIPNSLVISSAVRRKKRHSSRNTSVDDW